MEKKETDTSFTEKFSGGASVEALDEQRLKKALEKARDESRVADEREAAEERQRWEHHQNIAAGGGVFLGLSDRAFRAFHHTNPTSKELGTYEHLLRQFRVGMSLYRRDIEAAEKPSFAVLEILDVQADELKRIAEAIREIDNFAPGWNDDMWRSASERNRFTERERVLCERFSCTAEDIAYDDHQITDTTKVYAGPIRKGIFDLLRHVEHVIIEPSDEEVIRETADIGKLRNLKEYTETFLRLGWTLVIEPEVQEPKQSALTVVKLTGAQLGQNRASRDLAREIASIAGSFGLRSCTPAEALSLILWRFRQGDRDTRVSVPVHMDGFYDSLIVASPEWRQINYEYTSISLDTTMWFVIPGEK